MIKLFRKIRQDLLERNKTGKYLKYAIGEIVLVVIGILIALQLNTQKEDQEKAALGHKYLLEMKEELQDDIFNIDDVIKGIEININNQEAALNTKNLATLPLDSLLMIIDINLIDFKFSQLTFTKMNNLGLSTLTNNNKLNTKISNFYSNDITYLSSTLDIVSRQTEKYVNYMNYEQGLIDLSLEESEFSSLYLQSKQDLANSNSKQILDFITSTKGRNLTLSDLKLKRRSLSETSHIQKRAIELLNAIHTELKMQDPQIAELPVFPTEISFTESKLPKEILQTYTGKYVRGIITANILLEDAQLYLEFDKTLKIAIYPYEHNKFFAKRYFIPIQFNEEDGKIINFTIHRDNSATYQKAE